jgi:hypothetical protein
MQKVYNFPQSHNYYATRKCSLTTSMPPESAHRGLSSVGGHVIRLWGQHLTTGP